MMHLQIRGQLFLCNFASSYIIVIHAGQVVVNQGVGVHQLNCCGNVEKSFGGGGLPAECFMRCNAKTLK